MHMVLNSMSVQQPQIGEAGIDQPRAEPVPSHERSTAISGIRDTQNREAVH